MKATRLAIVLVSLASGGCKAKPEPRAGRDGPVAADAGVNYVRVTGCTSHEVSMSSAQVRSDLGHVDHCGVQSDGGVTIELEVVPGGSLEIDGAAVLVAPDGKASVRYLLDPLVLAGPVGAVLADGAGVVSPRLPVRMTRGGDAIDGVIEVHAATSARTRARALLAAAARGQALGGDRATRASLVYLPPSPYERPAHHGRLGRLDEVGLVAVARDLEPRDGGACGPYSDGAPASPRRLIDVAIAVHDTVTGAVILERTFTEDHEVCGSTPRMGSKPGEPFEARPPTRAIARWLDQVVREPPR